MLNDLSRVTFCDPLPAAVDVVVIGGGIIGIASAWFLARAGVSVLVCEKGRIAGEQSSRNWGWVRQQGRDAAELPIMMESIRIWDSLARETGEDLGFTRAGVLYLAEDQRELGRFERWLEIARAHQLDTRLLNGAETSTLTGRGVVGRWRGALYTASDGRAEPSRAVPALARAAQRLGVRVVERCAVRVLDVQAGEVCGVVTERGRVRAGAVLCAGGAWSSAFADNAGVELPQLSVRATVARTAREGPALFAGCAAARDLAFRRRHDGGYTVAAADFHEHFVGRDTLRYGARFLPSLRAAWQGTRLRLGGEVGGGMWRRLRAPRHWDGDTTTAFERIRVLDPAPSAPALARLRARLAARLPALADVPVAETWAGLIDTTPDVLPVIDAAPGCRGWFIATGFSGHGFGIGPGAGRVVADLVQGRSGGHDLHRFRLSRFSDGSRLELGPAL